MDDRIDFSISKMIFKGLLDENTPRYLQLQIQESTRLLRNSQQLTTLMFKDQPNVKSSFLDYANKVYNEIPQTIKTKKDSLSAISSKLKKFFYDKTLARSLK